MDSGNPYVPPKMLEPHPIAGDVVLDGPDELEFRRSVSFIFENPNWFINLLCVTLCTVAGQFIPILPAIVLIGYQFEIIESLLARPYQTFPDFKFDRIVKYLLRGLYPFVVALIGILCALPIYLIVLAIPVGLSAALLANVDEETQTILLFILIPIGVVVLIVLGFLMNLILVPLTLRAGLAQDIGSAFNYQFVKDFVIRMWKDVLYSGVFLFVVAIAAVVVGLLIFCVGYLVTISVVQLAQAHLAMQIYRLYLLRGGDRILPKATDAIVVS